MTRRKRVALLALTVLSALVACATLPTPPLDATEAQDAAAPTEAGPRTFTITVVDDDLLVDRGASVSLDVIVHRSGGFDAPVLVELPGLPDPCITQAREARPGDAITTLTIRADVDGDPTPRTPFVVQASTLEGLRQTAPAHITVR